MLVSHDSVNSFSCDNEVRGNTDNNIIEKIGFPIKAKRSPVRNRVRTQRFVNYFEYVEIRVPSSERERKIEKNEVLIDNKAYVNCKENIDIKMNKIIPPIPCLKSNQRQQDAIKMMHNI